MDKIEKIKGWVARDEDDGLHFFVEVPKRYNRRGVFEMNPGVWSLNEWQETHTLCLDRKSFSDLKWENEPLEVELTIKRVSTLSEESDKSLEEEMKRFIDAHYHTRFDETLENGNDPLTVFDFEDIARHFAQWGAEHLKR